MTRRGKEKKRRHRDAIVYQPPDGRRPSGTGLGYQPDTAETWCSVKGDQVEASR
jgi:hypothetical protein